MYHAARLHAAEQNVAHTGQPALRADLSQQPFAARHTGTIKFSQGARIHAEQHPEIVNNYARARGLLQGDAMKADKTCDDCRFSRCNEPREPMHNSQFLFPRNDEEHCQCRESDHRECAEISNFRYHTICDACLHTSSHGHLNTYSPYGEPGSTGTMCSSGRARLPYSESCIQGQSEAYCSCRDCEFAGSRCSSGSPTGSYVRDRARD